MPDSMAAISSVGSPSAGGIRPSACAPRASCDSMRRRKASSGRVSRRADAQLAALTTTTPSTSATNRRAKTYDSTTSSWMPSQRTRPSGSVTATHVVGCGVPRVNSTSPAGTPSARSVDRSAEMRGAHEFDGTPPSGRSSLTRTASAPGARDATSASPAAARSAGAQRSAVSRATVRLRST